MLKNKAKVFLGVIILFHSFLLTKLIFFPYPELFVYPYLTNLGLKPYSQILDQHFPGLMFLPLNLDNLGMNDEMMARVWLISVVILTQLLLFWVSRQVLKSDKKALLVNLLYLFWQPFFEGWILWIDTFLPLFLLPAFYLTFKLVSEDRKQFKKGFSLGLFLGVGIVFKQIVIPLSVLVLLYLLWQKKSFKILLSFLNGLLLPIFVMLLYLIQLGVIKDFWYWTVTFNLTTFAEFGRKPPFFSGIVRIAFVTLFSMSILFLKDKKLIHTLLIFIIGSLVAIYARFDFVHFQPALPFILIASVASVTSLWSKFRFRLAMIIYIIVLIWWLGIFYKGHLSNQVKFFDSQTKLIATKIKQNTHPGEKIFIFGSVPHLYQMSQTKVAGDIFVFQFPWFLMVTEDRLLDGLKKDSPNIVVADRSVEIEGNKITNFAKKLDEYILKNYQTFDSTGTTQIMRRITE